MHRFTNPITAAAIITAVVALRRARRDQTTPL